MGLDGLKCCLFSPQRSIWNFFHFLRKNLWAFHKVVILFLSFLLRPTENGICNATWDTSIYTDGRYIICSRKLSGLIGKYKLFTRGTNHIRHILNDRLEEVVVHECISASNSYHFIITIASSYYFFNSYILHIYIYITYLSWVRAGPTTRWMIHALY